MHLGLMHCFICTVISILHFHLNYKDAVGWRRIMRAVKITQCHYICCNHGHSSSVDCVYYSKRQYLNIERKTFTMRGDIPFHFRMQMHRAMELSNFGPIMFFGILNFVVAKITCMEETETLRLWNLNRIEASFLNVSRHNKLYIKIGRAFFNMKFKPTFNEAKILIYMKLSFYIYEDNIIQNRQ